MSAPDPIAQTFDLASLAAANTLGGSPTQALFDLGRIVREALASVVVMTVDLHADRSLDDPRVAFDQALGDPDVRRTRVIGPASGGISSSSGGVALISAIGPLAPRIATAIGGDLGLAVDLGLGWDLAAEGLIAAVLASGQRFHTLGLALTPSAYRGLARALRAAQGHVAIFALAAAQSPTALALAGYGVACVSDLGALARALATAPADRPRGNRIAVVTGTGPLSALVAPALEAAGLQLAKPSQATLGHLASELPAQTRMTPFVQIPGATARHAALAVESLRADFLIEHVFAFDLPGFAPRDPAIEAPHLAALATAARALAAGASPIPTPSGATPRAEALVAAAQLMRRTTLERETTTALLVALAGTATPLRPSAAFPVASLAAAHNAARRIGYPVLLGTSPDAIIDDDALTERWEALRSGLATSEVPFDRRAPDPFAAHVIQRAPTTAIQLTYRATPMPTVVIAGGLSLALPVRASELSANPAIAPALQALSHLAERTPEVATLALVVQTNDDACVIIHATATLASPDDD